MMSPRPPRISRDDVLSAARDLVDENGVDWLTMRRLGAALHADPMTAYRHFPGKAELAAALADQFWIELPLPDAPTTTDWRTYAAELMRTIRRTLAAHAGLIPIVATHPITSPAALAVADRAIGAMIERGAPLDPALGDVVNVLVMTTVASAMGEFSTPAGAEPEGAGAGAAGGGSEEEAALLAALPNLGRLLAAGWASSPERQFEEGIRAILQGWSLPSSPAS